jgi:hypothetical protein
MGEEGSREYISVCIYTYGLFQHFSVWRLGLPEGWSWQKGGLGRGLALPEGRRVRGVGGSGVVVRPRLEILPKGGGAL